MYLKALSAAPTQYRLAIAPKIFGAISLYTGSKILGIRGSNITCSILRGVGVKFQFFDVSIPTRPRSPVASAVYPNLFDVAVPKTELSPALAIPQ